MVANGYLVRTLTRSQAKNKRKIPNAHAHLHAVRVGFAVVVRLNHVHLRLLRCLAHSLIRLLRPGRQALPNNDTRKSFFMNRTQSNSPTYATNAAAE